VEDTGDKPEDTGDKPEDTGDEPEDTGDEPEDTGDEPEDTGDKPPVRKVPLAHLLNRIFSITYGIVNVMDNTKFTIRSGPDLEQLMDIPIA
jgi:hypothetical protein